LEGHLKGTGASGGGIRVPADRIQDRNFSHIRIKTTSGNDRKYQTGYPDKNHKSVNPLKQDILGPVPGNRNHGREVRPVPGLPGILALTGTAGRK